MNLLFEWLGDGGHPVDQNRAEGRARICLRCPMHTEEKWWEVVKSTIADWIKSVLEIKSKMNLRLSCEDEMMMCRACGCCARLKVWVPLEVIVSKTTPEMMKKFVSDCWIKTESKLQ